MTTINITHTASLGHIIENHFECSHLHGHDFDFEFEIQYKSTEVKIVDYLLLNDRLKNWIDTNWKNKLLVHHKHEKVMKLYDIDTDGVVPLVFEPTIENLAEYLVVVIGNQQLLGTQFFLAKVKITQSKTISATYQL